jgi:hypothetical protein
VRFLGEFNGTAFLLDLTSRPGLDTVYYECCITMQISMSVFWDVAPCSVVDINRRFRGAYCSIIRAMSNIEGSKFFWNVGQYLPDYTVHHPRRQPHSHLTPCESQNTICNNDTVVTEIKRNTGRHHQAYMQKSTTRRGRWEGACNVYKHPFFRSLLLTIVCILVTFHQICL